MNSGYTVEATVARLRNPASEAVAPNKGPRLMRDIEASLQVKTQKIPGFAEAFQLIASQKPGTSGLLFILSRPDVSSHAVIIMNYGGEPTIIEAQSWGPSYPQRVYTSAAEAQARYGAEVDLRLGILPVTAQPPTPS